MQLQQVFLLTSVIGICVSQQGGSNYFQLNRRTQANDGRFTLGKQLQLEDPVTKTNNPQSLESKLYEAGIEQPELVLASLEDALLGYEINGPISSVSNQGSISKTSASTVSGEPTIRKDVSQQTPAIFVIHVSETKNINPAHKFEKQKVQVQEKEENLIASISRPTAASQFKISDKKQHREMANEDSKSTPEMSSSSFQSEGMRHPFNTQFEQKEATNGHKFAAQEADKTKAESFGQSLISSNIQSSHNPPQATAIKQVTETRTRPSFPPSLTSHLQTSETEESSDPLNLNSEKEEAEDSPRFGLQQKIENVRVIDVRARPRFPPSLSTSELMTSEIEQSVEPSKSKIQNGETKVHSGFNHHTEKVAEQATETKKSSFPPSHPLSLFQASKVKQPIESNDVKAQNEDNVSSHGFSMQTKRVVDGATEIMARPSFPPSLSTSQLQKSEKKQSSGPSTTKVMSEDSGVFSKFSPQSEEASEIKTETKARPIFPPSHPTTHFLTSEVKQTLEPAVNAAQKEVFVASSGFSVQPQKVNGHATKMRVTPSFPPSNLKTSDFEQSLEPSNVEEPTEDSVISQMVKEQMSARPSFPPSLPSSNLQISGSRQPLKSSNEETQQDEDLEIPAQKPVTRKFYSPDTKTNMGSMSSFQPAEPALQFPGTKSAPELKVTSAHEMLQPISYFSIPKRFQNNLFRDVGYASPPVQNRPNVALLKSHSLGPNEDGAYGFIFESEDGIYREEQGALTQPSINAKAGAFSYVAPDGTIVETTYVADERGYRTQSSPLARIHDSNLPTGKDDRVRSAATSSDSNVKKSTARESQVTREKKLRDVILSKGEGDT